MPRKRKSTKSSDVKKTKKSSDAIFQQDGNAKLAKHTSVSDTPLSNLPIELLGHIFVTVVTMEVTRMKLAKSAWKEKAGLVISRLKAVCLQWSSVLAISFFRNKVHRTLGRVAQRTIHMEVLYQSSIKERVYRVATLKDDIFIRSGEGAINVYRHNNVTAVAKDVIPLPGLFAVDMAGCVFSNCVYVLCKDRKRKHSLSILRITKDEEHRFMVSPFVTACGSGNVRESLLTRLSVAANGNLVLMWDQQEPNAVVNIQVYRADGSLQQTTMLNSVVCGFGNGVNDVLHKSNGSLVLVSVNDQRKTQLTEITLGAHIVRRYQSTLMGEDVVVNVVDVYDRILISEKPDRFELLDSEFNILPFIGDQFRSFDLLHCNIEKNEAVGVYAEDCENVLTVFRFTEE